MAKTASSDADLMLQLYLPYCFVWGTTAQPVFCWLEALKLKYLAIDAFAS
mgnify:CR=1 FL=1